MKRQPQPSVTRCRSCGAAIVWATTSKGKPMPLNVEGAAPVKAEGRVVAVKSATGYHVVQATSYTCHFATCAQAAQWRKPKDGGQTK